MRTLFRSAVFMLLVALPLLGAAQEGEKKPRDTGEKPKYANLTFVPTADEVIDKMFELAKVTKDDVIFDLGCGDNRICFQAARRYKCRGVGIDINPERIREAMSLAQKYDVGLLVETRHGDALKVKDLGDASVVVMYMFPEFMNLWLPIAREKLKPGTRILSHDYSFSSWKPDVSVTVKSSTREHKVHMWTMKKPE
jgi:cyclopropane fatty-acyl-phospholipid synthase-like methyltransferase